MRIAIWGGFFLSFPVIAYQLWRFIAPGLYRSEKSAFLPFLVASPLMFALGAVLAYIIVLPWAFGPSTMVTRWPARIDVVPVTLHSPRVVR